MVSESPGQAQSKITTSSIQNNKPQQSDFDNVSFVPEGFIEEFAENILDIIWDVDGDKDFDGLLIVLYNFIPGIGVNGDQMVQPIFYAILVSGMYLFAKRYKMA